MASEKISQLPSASTSSGSDLYTLVQAGVNKSITFTALQSALVGGGGVVSSLNGLMGALNLVAGSNVTISASGSSIMISSSGSGGGGISALTGDVLASGSGSVPATVAFVGGSAAADVHTAELAANSANNFDIPSTIVKRDSSGNFSAGAITATLLGNVIGNVSGSAGSFTGSLAGDVIGTQGATVVSAVGGSSAANVHSAELAANAATNLDTFSTIVKRDASGNFSAATITANLTGNVSGSSGSFTGSLAGDVTGTQGATVISASTVTGKLLTGYVVGSNTPIAATDSILGAFEKIQGQINNTDLSAITALTGDVSASGPGSVPATVNSVGGSSATNIHSAELAANAATSANTPSTIVKRDGSSNFSAGTITSALIGNVTGNVSGSSGSFTGSLAGDVTGTQGATVVSAVGGSSAANVHSAELAANAATNADIVSTIVKRDSSGNFSAGTITANLIGNISGSASSATSFTGSLAGDVTGTQGATVVAFVGGSSAANVHSAELAANAATNLNTASTIVKRDASGNFITTSEEITGFLQFDNASAPATPASGKSDIYVDATNGVSRLRFVDSTGLVQTIGRDSYNLAVNNTGVTLNKGQVIYINGVSGGLSTVALANANSSSTAPAYAVVAESIANGATGHIQFTGVLTGINTTGFTSGQPLYLSASVAGGLTNIAPTTPNIAQVIGIALTIGSSGSLTLSIGGNLNALNGNNIDGGSASSIYTAAQVITGGTP